MSTLDRMIVQILPYVPRPVVRRVSARYIAGPRLDDALRTVADLNRAGVHATVDVLGENVHELSESRYALQAYGELLDALWERRLDAQISVKLTLLGLQVDAQACLEHTRQLVQQAAHHGNFVAIDMEDSSCTDATLDIFLSLHRDTPSVGAVLQACLRRSSADLERLLPLEPNVRICKGIYIEPLAIAFQDRDEVRASFVALVDRMLAARSFVGIATHDEVLVEKCTELVRRHAAGRDRYEFQMLLGVREELRRRLLAAGHPVRVYVPYGEHWYAYSLRRLKENPALAGQVFRNLFDKRH